MIIPVKDRAAQLARCLAGLEDPFKIIVVDDGSADAAAIAAVCATRGARLIRTDTNRGPAAARNRALAEVDSELVAMIDSDCRPTGDWITRLAAHLADPAVAVVAPRIVGVGGRRPIDQYTQACGGLDLGRREARVAPLTRVAYVPTAALVARRSALLAVARDGAVFDETMRVGEDVDLIWRLAAAGGRIRYDPSVEVIHDEPTSWAELFSRRFRYGTSAAPLAARHPDAMVPLVVYPWPLLTTVGVVTGQPVAVAAGVAGTFRAARSALTRADLAPREALTITATATVQTLTGVSRYATQLGGLGLIAAAVSRRRAALALLLLGPVIDWLRLRPRLDPMRFAAARVADETSYGAGVWTSVVRARSLRALKPKLAR